MCEHALHRSSRSVCFSWVGSRVLTHAYTSHAPPRPIDIRVSLTRPKRVRLNLCASRLCTHGDKLEYRATDSHGKTHFTDRLVGVPIRLDVVGCSTGKGHDLSSKTKFQSTVGSGAYSSERGKITALYFTLHICYIVYTLFIS